MGSLLLAVSEARLLQDAHQSTPGQVVAARSGDCNETGFRGMFELPVTTPRAVENPSVVGEQSEDNAHFHCRQMAGDTYVGSRRVARRCSA